MRRQFDLRQNEARALQALFQGGPLSRADLARALGLTRAATGNLVQQLIATGLVREGATTAGDGESRIGRPGILLEIAGNGAFFLGGMIGVDRITVTAVDLAGRPRIEARRPFGGAGCNPVDAIRLLRTLVDEVSAALPGEAPLLGLLVTVPGFLLADGLTCHATILGWHGLDLSDLVAEALGDRFPVALENDANAVAVAETYPRGEGGSRVGDILVLLLETGVGGGIITGGQLHRGRLRGAGEVGHMLMGAEGYIHDPERPGRWETYVGKAALLARWHYHGGGPGGLDALCAALASGDAAARRAARDWAHWLARGLVSLASTLQPERVVIAGSASAVYPFVADEVAGALAAGLVEGFPCPEIVLSRQAGDVPALGAALLLHQTELDAAATAPSRGPRLPFAVPGEADAAQG